MDSREASIPGTTHRRQGAETMLQIVGQELGILPLEAVLWASGPPEAQEEKMHLTMQETGEMISRRQMIG